MGSMPRSGTPGEFAQALIDLFCDDAVKAIFDISGENLANHIISHLDYAQSKRDPKPFVDLAMCLLSLTAIYAVPDLKPDVTRFLNSRGQIRHNTFGGFTKGLCVDSPAALVSIVRVAPQQHQEWFGPWPHMYSRLAGDAPDC